ncbi:RluA family pseudouridine synthase [Kerstersia gyiorum]|uniref:RluA family pseudouridine synthase n=1 Tax=Kerstersia gyiorum TaxID=206506 RepID=UPI0020A06F3F|nr:RluA family pseudouridine synthase [Kerstersia gyiorum]MCP1633507.1 23S rRNA pseudouridine1911/1915/1917 synthase [Kerstersia gyiorum]MCP1637238.1 23S rRNA pseudouridine1911/1915/1917 synthase [Kerstersia gyiorum]MCP1672203.1 23S rRNA pseudouridine1911/1915/1917 synthase [Kerstersia gyiorum]MCP1679697.1 23S rRNA pseudouridine1911/1915/1917 synthase [Kerstersia gyiorum]MCP1682741.1 23S rRNA pseudouridine1911/1915/1917 synthase [Kerstersia gyiorum]
MPERTDSPVSLSEDDALELVVPESFRADRLDKVLAALLDGHSRARLQAWIEAGAVHINDSAAPAKVRTTVYPGDVLNVVPQPAPEDRAFEPQDVAFEVIADSPDWIVVNKPAGLVTHPGAGNWQGTLLNGLLYRYPELAGVARAGIVHRLDKDTSGLLVVARNELAQTHLVRQLQARTMGREYMALAQGWVARDGTVDRAIGRDRRVPVRMAVDNPVAPKPAVTHYSVVARGKVEALPVTEVVCRLETGRTHQIRVHLASLGHPLLADEIYGGRTVGGAQRQMLHARALRFEDPAGHGLCQWQAPVPADMQQVRETIEWDE